MSVPTQQHHILVHGSFDMLTQGARLRLMVNDGVFIVEKGAYESIQSGYISPLNVVAVVSLTTGITTPQLEELFVRGAFKFLTASNHLVRSDGLHAATLLIVGTHLNVRFTLDSEGSVVLLKDSSRVLDNKNFSDWPLVKRVLNLVYGNGSTVGRSPQSA